MAEDEMIFVASPELLKFMSAEFSAVGKHALRNCLIDGGYANGLGHLTCHLMTLTARQLDITRASLPNPASCLTLQ